MDEHVEIRELLTLAAAGALDDAEQRRVQDHLRHCQGCRAELAQWQQLTGALQESPTPEAPLGLVERTRRQMANKAAGRAEQRYRQNLLVWLTVLAWINTLMSWVGFRWMGERVALALGVSFTVLTVAWISYTLTAWLATALAAALLGRRYQEGGHYEPVF
jgi:predicted anti-sigma-YlaC factor YlaD